MTHGPLVTYAGGLLDNVQSLSAILVRHLREMKFVVIKALSVLSASIANTFASKKNSRRKNFCPGLKTNFLVTNRDGIWEHNICQRSGTVAYCQLASLEKASVPPAAGHHGKKPRFLFI